MIVVSMLLVILILGIVIFFDETKSRVSEATGLVVSLESFPTYVETHPIMKDIPKDATINLEIGGQAYGIAGKEIIKDKIIAYPDISISFPAGYETRIGEIGICSALEEAVKNEDLNLEIYASKTKLLTKYYKLIKYKKCFGE